MKNELQTLRLFSPLFPHIYRRNDWGDLENEPEDLSASEILEYEDAILDRIEKEKLPDEGEPYLSFWDASDRFFIKPEDEMDGQSFGLGMGGLR